MLEGFVRRAAHDSMILLVPEHDDARRLVHEMRCAGSPVHVVERPEPLPEALALHEVAVIAAHYLRARWIVPLRLDEVLSSSDDLAARALDGDALRREEPATPPARREDRRAVLRTTTLPGPAHKEHIAAILRPGVARSIVVPLHVPMYTTAIRLTLENLGCALVEIDALRIFRPGAAPVEVDPLDLTAVLRVGGPAMLTPAPPLQVFAVNGDMELWVDVERLWRSGVCDALELRVTATPVSPDRALSSAMLDALGAAYRDPWAGVAVAQRALVERTEDRVARNGVAHA